MFYFLSKFLILAFFVIILNNEAECACLQMTNGVPSYSNGPDCIQISTGGNGHDESNDQIYSQKVGKSQSDCSTACVGSMCARTCN